MAYYSDGSWKFIGWILALGMMTLFALCGAVIGGVFALPVMLWTHDFAYLPTALLVGAGGGVFCGGLAFRPWEMWV